MPYPLTPHAESAHNYQLLIKCLLQAPLVFNPDQEIVYADRLRFDYRTLHERIHRLANVLIALGVKPGATVAIMDYDSHRYLECFFAVPMIGAVLHTINVRLSPEQILYTIDHTEDDILMVNGDFLPIIHQIKGRIDTVKAYILLNDKPQQPVSSISFAGEYETLLSAAVPQFEFPDLDENTPATIFYTNGTTGLPKGVYFSHRQLVLHTMAVLAAFGTAQSQGRFHREDVYMPITPMYHAHAWGFPYVATVMGVKQVYPGRYIPEQLLQLIECERVTFSHCVPTLLNMLLKAPMSAKMDLSNWKVIVGGASLSKTLCLEAMRRGIDVFTGYGMSETCPALTLAQLTTADLAEGHEVQAELRCKTGTPFPLVHLRVVNEQWQDVARDGCSSGEIIVRAPWLTRGYLKNHHGSEKLWKGGWLHTSDLANIDDRGFVKINGRTKDAIKTGGEWISTLELEDLFASIPEIAEVAVVGQPDELWGERPLALVVLKAECGDKFTEKELKHLLRGFSDKGYLTKRAIVRLVDAIDKTSDGQVDKAALREKYIQA